MVGVAGKSKGCNTCRRRKKGCDLARPICGQCLKSGNPCGGYQRDLTFIHHKVPGKGQQPSSATKQSPKRHPSHLAGYRSLAVGSEGWSSRTSSEQSPAATADHDGRESSALVQRTSPLSPSLQMLSPSLDLTALTTFHISLFNSFYLPRNSFAIPENPGPFGHPANWTQLIPPLLHNDPSIQFSYLALSSSRIGHDNHDDNLLASSKKLYGKALREMQRALLDPRRRYTEETLLACSTLGLYEIFEAQTSAEVQNIPTPNGWLSHAAGVARLLEARGAEAYTTDKAHPIFLHARIMITIRASTARQACFLSETEWLIIPWRNHPKNMLHRLIDGMVFLPVVLETYDTLETNRTLDTNERHLGRKRLLDKCSELNEKLQNWYIQLCVDAGDLPLWHTSQSIDPSYPFPELFSFDDHLIAYAIMLYWTCSLVIQGTMRQLQHLLNKDASGFYDEERLPDHINPRLYAVNIGQTLLSLVHPDMGALGPNIVLFPLGMALGFFATPMRTSSVAGWLRSAGSMVEGFTGGKIPDGKMSENDIVLWFVKLLRDLSSRSMPGGVFLSGLMRAVGNPTLIAGTGSVSDV
jgi:Fungal specific transcription factor domain/Fungal Zn(2)-Cys(6) binuclear cluster domain